MKPSRLLLALAPWLFLTGCVSLAPKPDPAATRLPMVAATEAADRQKIRETTLAAQMLAWSSTGVVRWTKPNAPVRQANFFWQQSGSSWVATLNGDVVGSMLHSERGWFFLDGDGKPTPSDLASVDGALIKGIGVDGPWMDVLAWTAGRRVNEKDILTFGPDGLPTQLVASTGDWRVSYRRWIMGAFPMPEDVLIQGPEGVEINIKVGIWTFRNPQPDLPGLAF